MAQLPGNLPLNRQPSIATDETSCGLILPGRFLQGGLDRHRTFPDHIGASNAVIIEPCGLHEGWLKKVPAVHHDWVTQKLLYPAKVQSCKVFPLGEHQAGVSAFKGFISPARELDWAIRAKLLRGTPHGCRIIRRNRTTFF